MNTKWEEVGEVGVDSAHVLIGDANYVGHLSQDWGERAFPPGGNYDATMKNDTARVYFGMAEGVVCVSGAGDGVYKVYVKRGDDMITHMMIDFSQEDPNAESI